MTPSSTLSLPTPPSSFAHAVHQHGGWRIATFLFVTPMGKGFKVPLALMAFGGIALAFCHSRAVWQHTSIRWLLLVCFRVPLVTAPLDTIASRSTFMHKLYATAVICAVSNVRVFCCTLNGAPGSLPKRPARVAALEKGVWPLSLGAAPWQAAFGRHYKCG